MNYVPSNILRAMVIAVLAAAAVSCGDDSGDADTSSGSEERGTSSTSPAADAGPGTSCKVPTGTFALTSTVSEVIGAGCSVASRTLSASVQLAGSLEDFLSPSCTGTATWAPGSLCTVRTQETCSNGTTTRELTLGSDGSTLRGTQTQRDSKCEVRAALSGSRSSTTTGSTTPSSTRLDVQLYYENGVAVGEGGYLHYIRYRLRSNGTYSACEYEVSIRPGAVNGTPFKSQGSYEIVGSSLQLNSASGASTNLSFSYSAATGRASIDGKAFSEETTTSDAALCNFGV